MSGTKNFNPQSFKWITSDDKKSLVIHNVVPVFWQQQKKICNLISIFGRARQGKSFLMNCLAGETDLFQISNEKESCTQGIDISNKWLGLNEFSRIDNNGRGSNDKQDIQVGFVDAEGQGDKDVSYDAKLICPILLASKCVIFNWKGDMQKDHMLSTLGIMTRAAQNVSLDAEQGTKKKKFGHLHIIFRDWQSEGSDSISVYRMLFDEEGSREGSTRDSIRREVLASFESIHVWLFDAPTDSVKDLKKKLKFEQTSVSFRANVRELRACLTSQLSTPTLFGGEVLKGREFAPILSTIASALNRGEVILPSSAYESMLKEEMYGLQRKYEEDLRDEVENLLVEFESSIQVKDVNLDGRISKKRTRSENEDKPVIYITEQKASQRFENVVKNLDNKLEESMNEMSLNNSKSSSRYEKLYREHPEILNKIKLKQHQYFISKYRNQFGKWLLQARQKAENVLNDFVAPRIKSIELPMNMETLNDILQDCWIQIIEIIGGSGIYVDVEVVKDSERILERQFKPLADLAIKANREMVSQLQKNAHQILVRVKQMMDNVILEHEKVVFKNAAMQFHVEAVAQYLNSKFSELVEWLESETKKENCELFKDEIRTEFLNYCGTVNQNLNSRLEIKSVALDEARSVAFNKFSEDFHLNIQSFVAQHSSENDIKSAVAEMVHKAILYAVGNIQHFFVDDEERSFFCGDLLEKLMKAMEPKIIEVMHEITENQNIAIQRQAEIDANNAAAAAEPYIPPASSNKQKLSVAEQKMRAQLWAQQQLGLVKGKKGKSLKMPPPKPKKSAAQQRADAAKFAKEQWGITASDDEMDNDDDEKPMKGPKPVPMDEDETLTGSVRSNMSTKGSSRAGSGSSIPMEYVYVDETQDIGKVNMEKQSSSSNWNFFPKFNIFNASNSTKNIEPTEQEGSPIFLGKQGPIEIPTSPEEMQKKDTKKQRTSSKSKIETNLTTDNNRDVSPPITRRRTKTPEMPPKVEPAQEKKELKPLRQKKKESKAGGGEDSLKAAIEEARRVEEERMLKYAPASNMKGKEKGKKK